MIPTANLFQFVRNASNLSTLSTFVREVAVKSGIKFDKIKIDRVVRVGGAEGEFLHVVLDDNTTWKVSFKIEKVL